MKPSLILINPWIYDFAAYDLWSKPLGLLYVAGYLRRCGFKIHLIDCLDVHHPGMKSDGSTKKPTRRLYGTGKFFREKVPRPLSLKEVPRPYSRYGITRDLFIKELEGVRQPEAILVTSLMTYWYPGVVEAIKLAKEHHPGVPVILGGIYARLCREHALRFSGADLVASEIGPNKPDLVTNLLERYKISPQQGPFTGSKSYCPAFDMLRKIDYVCLLTSTGCPYKCRYCASPFLNPVSSRREPGEILDEILYWHKDFGVRDFAFYDDALLARSDVHIAPMLEDLIRRKLDLRFHTPNGLHVREITPEMARLLFLSGFRTIRLGLETSDLQLHRDLGNKVGEGEFERAVQYLKKAGFSRKDLGAYILIGLPGQTVDSVVETIRFVGNSGANPYLAEYSPLPHTPLWEKAMSCSRYDLATEPLFHNNTLLSCWDEARRKKASQLKRLVMEIRHGRWEGGG